MFFAILSSFYETKLNKEQFKYMFMTLKKLILRKLFRHRVIGGKHTAVEHLAHGLPRHLVGDAKIVIEELIKEGFIIPKPTNYGLQVSLNPERIEEIIKIIET